MIFWIFPLHINLAVSVYLQSCSCSLPAKIGRHFSQLRLKTQITSTLLQYIQRCVVVSKTLGSHRVPNTGVLSSLRLRLLISLSYFSLLQPAETAPALFAFACDLVSPSLPGCYCAESSLECSFLLRNNPSRTSTYKSFFPLNSVFILHNHTKIHQQVIRQPFWLIAHYPSPLFFVRYSTPVFHNSCNHQILNCCVQLYHLVAVNTASLLVSVIVRYVITPINIQYCTN